MRRVILTAVFIAWTGILFCQMPDFNIYFGESSINFEFYEVSIIDGSGNEIFSPVYMDSMSHQKLMRISRSKINLNSHQKSKLKALIQHQDSIGSSGLLHVNVADTNLFYVILYENQIYSHILYTSYSSIKKALYSSGLIDTVGDYRSTDLSENSNLRVRLKKLRIGIEDEKVNQGYTNHPHPFDYYCNTCQIHFHIRADAGNHLLIIALLKDKLINEVAQSSNPSIHDAIIANKLIASDDFLLSRANHSSWVLAGDQELIVCSQDFNSLAPIYLEFKADNPLGSYLGISRFDNLKSEVENIVVKKTRRNHLSDILYKQSPGMSNGNMIIELAN